MSSGYCSATIKYNIKNSDGSDNWRTQTCGLLKSDSGYEHEGGGTKHEAGNVTWTAGIGSNTELPDGQLPDGA